MLPKNKTTLPKKFPYSVREGSVSVSISRVKLKPPHKGVTYKIYWYEGKGVRKEKRRVDLEDALDLATQKAKYLDSAQSAADRLKRDQKEAYIYAQDLAGSTPLVTAIKEWKKAKELTAGNLIPAAQAWHDRHLGTVELFDVNEIIKRFKVAKERAGIIWKTNYQKTFPGFQNAFGKKIISTITTRQLQDWLDKSFAHPTTRNTHRKRIVVLWRWARSQNYLPRQVQTEAELTERAKEPNPKREIISPQTYRDLLSLVKVNHPHYIPALVLAGFCGLRPDEVHGQVWEDIKLDQNILKVTAAKVGTASYRHVPICSVAVEWILMSSRKRVGKICSNQAIDRIRKIGRTAGFKLPANCFRHSFVSYRTVQIGNIDQTAQEAGNSPRVIHKHYRELVTKEEAKDWFLISTKSERGKVLSFEQGK